MTGGAPWMTMIIGMTAGIITTIIIIPGIYILHTACGIIRILLITIIPGIRGTRHIAQLSITKIQQFTTEDITRIICRPIAITHITRLTYLCKMVTRATRTTTAIVTAT